MAGPKRRGIRIALIVLAIVMVLPVLGVGVVAMTYDANRLKPRIVAAIEQATGRAVAIDGSVRLGLSLRPTLQVDGVTLANAPGFAPASMATLGRLDLRLALLPLLQRHIEIEQLDLLHPVIALQIDAQGRDNWHFRPPQAPPTTGAPAAPPSGAPRTTLRIRTMRIADGAVTFDDARTHASFGIDAVDLTATQADPDGAIQIDLTAKDHAMPLAVSGDVGAPRADFMPIDLTLQAADARLRVKGSAPRFAVVGTIPDLSALSVLAGSRLPAWHDLSFQADVAPPGGATYAAGMSLAGLRVGAPTGEIAGDASIAFAAPQTIRAALTGRNLDPATLIAALPAPMPAPTTPAPTSATPAPTIAPSPAPSAAPPPPPSPAAAPAPVRVIPDRPLPFAAMPRLDADVTLTLRDTKAGAATIDRVGAHLVLHDGRLVLNPVSIDLPGGHVEATAMADASGAAALTLHAPSLSIQPLLSAFDEPDGVVGIMDLQADLHGIGTTPRALAASLHGSAAVALANGEIDNRLLVALLSRIAPEAGMLDLAGKSTRSALRCVALRADATRGVAELRALLLDTVPLRLTGSGTIDLAQEMLSLRLLPLARIGGTGISVPVNIGGTFHAPRASVDAAAGGKGLGGIVMGALGADRLIAGGGEQDGCAEQLKLARFGDPGAVPPALPPQEAGKPQNLNSLLKQLLR